MSPVIRISDNTWRKLQKHAVPLEDTVDDVINKALLALDKSKGYKLENDVILKKNQKRVVGKKLPQKDFRPYILKVLRENSGRASVKLVKSNLLPLIKDKLFSADFEPVSSGDPRWWNAACFERNEMKKDGLISRDSERGIWELTSEGLNL